MILCVAQTQAMSLGEIRKGDWIQSREVEFKLDPDRA